MVGGDDFTVRGGAADASIWQKQVLSEQMANELRLPMVRLIDGSGGGGSVKSLETTGRTYVPANPGWEWVVANLATVPVVSLALGSVAGLGAARVVTSHYSVMVRRDLAGVRRRPARSWPGWARQVDKEGLGGSAIHARNGTVDDEAASEEEAIALARRSCPTCRRRCYDLPPRRPSDDPADRREDWLISAIPRNPRAAYKIRPVIAALVDDGSWLEMGRRWGRSAVTGLARLDGWPVAVLASDPYHYGGGLDRRRQPEGRPIRRPGRHLPPAGRASRRPARLRHRRGGRKGRHDPPRRPGAGRRLPGQGAVVLGDPATGVRRGRRGPPERGPGRPTATPGRRATGARCRWKAASRRPTRPTSRRPPTPRPGWPRSGPAGPGALAVPHRRDVPDRGDHRSPRHPAAAVRVRQPGRPAARCRDQRRGATARSRPPRSCSTSRARSAGRT